MTPLRFLSSPRLLAVAGALVFATVAYFAARQYLHEREAVLEAQVAERHATSKVLVSRVDLRAGDLISTDQLAARQMPKRYVPASAAEPGDVDRVAGQRVIHDVRSGEPLLWPLLAQPDGPAFSSGLDSGRRALTFPVDEVNAVAGMLVPGDLIDLLYSDTRSSGRTTVRPLLQRVPVLATGSMTRARNGTGDVGRSREGAAEFATITLSVTPEEAQLIVLAQRAGELTAVLRHPSDDSPAPAKAIDAGALLPAPPKRAAAQTVEYVQFITGGSKGVASDARLALPYEDGRAAERPAAPPTERATPKIDVGDVHARLGLGAAVRN
jgi:pilus assembly protein CpaB